MPGQRRSRCKAKHLAANGFDAQIRQRFICSAKLGTPRTCGNDHLAGGNEATASFNTSNSVVFDPERCDGGVRLQAHAEPFICSCERPEQTAILHLRVQRKLESCTHVFVNGAGLTGPTSANGVAFRALGRIDNTYGYPVPAGVNQLKSIPWIGGVNQIALRFSEDVAADLQQSDLMIRGSTTPIHAVSAFRYDAATKTGV